MYDESFIFHVLFYSVFVLLQQVNCQSVVRRTSHLSGAGNRGSKAAERARGKLRGLFQIRRVADSTEIT